MRTGFIALNKNEDSCAFAEHGPRPKPPLGFARHGYGPTRQWPKSRPCPNLAAQRPFRSPRSFAVLQASEQKKMRLLRSNDTPKVSQTASRQRALPYLLTPRVSPLPT